MSVLIKGHQSLSRNLSEVSGEIGTGLQSNFATVQNIGSDKGGLDIVNKSVFIAASDTSEANSTTRSIVATGHAARVGDIIRFTAGTNNGVEVSVQKIPDANTIIVASDLLAAPSTDNFDILRHVTPTLNSSGGLSVAAGDVSFLYDSVSTTVEEDTVTPSNNRPLPVKLLDMTGDINVTANDLHVQLEHNGANPDSVQIGDGTEVLAINASNEALVKDTDAAGLLTTIDADTGSIATDASTIASDTTSLDSKLPAQGAALTAASTPVNIASDQTVPVSASSLPLPTGAATETTLSTVAGDTTSIDGKLPATLGQKAKSASLAVTLASDEDAINTLQNGKSSVEIIRNDYTGTSVTTGAYVELVSSSSADINRMSVFDSSGETLKIAVGAAASEVDQFNIFPGGNGIVDLFIPSGSRISVRAVSATASVGELNINCFS